MIRRILAIQSGLGIDITDVCNELKLKNGEYVDIQVRKPVEWQDGVESDAEK